MEGEEGRKVSLRMRSERGTWPIILSNACCNNSVRVAWRRTRAGEVGREGERGEEGGGEEKEGRLARVLVCACAAR